MRTYGGRFAWEKPYQYGYGDQTIVYDAQGNPTTYLGHSLTWEKGRQLKSFDSNTYTYNANGIRTSKTVNGVKHTYTLDGTNILKETWGENTLVPMYDNEENVCGIIYNEEPYYFHKNLQGDVIAIADQNANVVARYQYDAWGVCNIVSDTTECGIAGVNPYGYRGYYFDVETGLYYLQSRYYNAQVGRFVNADSIEMLGLVFFNMIGANIYAYCYNIPVMLIDTTGCGVLPVSGIGSLYKSYKAAVKAWAKKYAPKSKGVEYGAIIHKVRHLFWTYYFMGETYKGFKTQNWYTVINGLGAGYLTASVRKTLIRILYPFSNLQIIGFAHTHPLKHDNKPSEPDKMMKNIGFIVGARVFPIAVYKNKKTIINYF